MASEAGKKMGKADDTVNQLTCAICLERFRRPKLLPCFHTFCQSCLHGVAGSSPSFPCPACRKVVLLPPGGVQALQTNFYIDKDMAAATPPSLQLQFCDVCTDDKEAAHVCVQCRQKFCQSCRKYHDAFTLSRGHSIVSVEQLGGSGEVLLGGKSEDTQVNELCTKHPTLPLLLYCRQCQSDMCMQCKLTKHDGHPTEDRADMRSSAESQLQAAESQLQVVLGVVTGRLQFLHQLTDGLAHRCNMLQQQEQLAEQDLVGRANMLQQWVSHCLEDAVNGMRMTVQQRKKVMQGHEEQLKNQCLGLQTLQHHLILLLKDRKATDVAALETLLSCSLTDDVGVERLKADLTKDNADVEWVKTVLTKDTEVLSVNHDLAAVNQAELHAFIGVVEPSQPPLCPEDGAKLSGLSTQEVEVRELGPSVESLCMSGSASHVTKCFTAAQKRPPSEFVYSKNPSSEVLTMCPISGNRVWISYKPDSSCSTHLRLLDAEKNVTTDLSTCGDICYLTDDTVIIKEIQKRMVLVRVDGSVTFHDMEFVANNIVFDAANKIHYLTIREIKNRTEVHCLLRIKFSLESKKKTDKEETQESTSTIRTRNAGSSEKLTIVEKTVVFESYSIIPNIECVSMGNYFACIGCWESEVNIYSKPTKGDLRIMSTYKPQDSVRGVCFCMIEGRELMLVTVNNDNRVHMVDHTDGCHFVKYLTTIPLTLQKPGSLASDDHSVWIACAKGKVVRIDL